MVGNWIGFNNIVGLSLDATSYLGTSSMNCFTGNVSYGVESLNSGASAALEHNYWGSSTGPTHSGNPGGSGDSSTDYVDYSPYATAPIGACVRPVTDFEHDGISDPAKFVPATGYAWWLPSSTGVWDAMHLGSDVATYVSRSDFDGDGMTDPGKYVSGSQALYYFQIL